MKKLMMLIMAAALIAGCARHRESNQGAGGYDNNGSMGTSTNSSAPTEGSQGGTSDQTTPTPTPNQPQ